MRFLEVHVGQQIGNENEDGEKKVDRCRNGDIIGEENGGNGAHHDEHTAQRLANDQS